MNVINKDLINFNWSNQYSSSFTGLYYKKFILLLLWVTFYTILSQGVFLSRLLVTIAVSLVMLLCFSKSFLEFKEKSPHMFFFLLYYCLVPTHFSLFFYIIGVILISFLLDFVFVRYDSYLFHPSLFMYIFIILLSLSYNFDFLVNTGIEYIIDTNISSSITIHIPSNNVQWGDFLYNAIGINSLSLYQPGIIVTTIFILLARKNRNFFYLFSVRYIILVFIYTGIFVTIYSFLTGYSMDLYGKNLNDILFYNLFSSPIFFIALFILPESLVSIQSINGKKKVVSIAALLSSIFIVNHISVLGPFLSIFLAQLLAPFFIAKKINGITK